MTRRVYFLAHGGMVQGVGFRFFVRKQATEYGLTGWVRNTPNNKVEGEAQGEDSIIKTFLKDVDAGPRGAKVVKLDTEDRDVLDGETGFEVRH
ncbi:hypothetical protein VMCG_01314 [Cytospora schulzeri]|uniref:acylphosphatase n=1 Tax=Cytospora schulzeri TaxID=448051 RepID=A0A423X6S5_9PEZI|nr:hypothetical protein VMCG_01314 [Valsa malicola]